MDILKYKIQKPREDFVIQEKVDRLISEPAFVVYIKSFDILEILYRIYVPFVYQERFQIKRRKKKKDKKKKRKHKIMIYVECIY